MIFECDKKLKKIAETDGRISRWGQYGIGLLIMMVALAFPTFARANSGGGFGYLLLAVVFIPLLDSIRIVLCGVAVGTLLERKPRGGLVWKIPFALMTLAIVGAEDYFINFPTLAAIFPNGLIDGLFLIECLFGLIVLVLTVIGWIASVAALKVVWDAIMAHFQPSEPSR